MVASNGNKRNRQLAADDQPLRPDSLVGSYFHSYGEDDELRWQGCVVAEPAPSVYLVETFDWIIGASSDQSLVTIGEMTKWRFFDTAEWMQNAYTERHKEALT